MKTMKLITMAAVLPLVLALSAGFKPAAPKPEEELKEFELIDYSIFWGGDGDEFVSFKYADTVYTNVAAPRLNITDSALLTVDDTGGLKKIGYVMSGENVSYDIYEREGYSIDEYIVAVKNNEFIINTAYVYQANDRRVSINISDVTPRGLTFRFETDTGYRMTYGDPFKLFKRNDNVWEPAETVENPALFTLVGYSVFPGDEMKPKKVDWRWQYGTLPAGDYMFHNDVLLIPEQGKHDTVRFWYEFTIE
jgi:hypothetical protein